MFKLNKLSILVYLFFFTLVISKISSTGVAFIPGFKLSPGDIILVLSIIYILLYKFNKFKEIVRKKEISIFILFILFAILMIPVGVLNGANITVGIRTIRNLIYIPATTIIVYIYFMSSGKKGILKSIYFISIMVILNAAIGIGASYINSGWYEFFRDNGLLTVYLVVFIFFCINSSKKIVKSLFVLIIWLILLLCSFFSQERTQLIVIGLTLIITLIVIIIKSNFMKKLNLVNVIKGSIVFIIFIILMSFIIRIDYISNYIDYYLEYRIGFLYNSTSVLETGSTVGRTAQLKTIVIENTNILNFFVGNGLVSNYKNALFNTYVVDSALLWSYKDLGIFGVVLISLFVFRMLIKSINTRIKSLRYSIFSGTLAIILMSAFVPSFFGNPAASFVFGYALAIIYFSIQIESE